MLRVLISIVLLSLFPTPGDAKRGVQFKPGNPLVLPSAKANETYRLDLYTMLEDTGSGELTFYLDEAPAWLTLNPPNSRYLVGNPVTGSIGNHSFKLSVKDSETADLDRPTVLAVLALPQFASNPIDLGTQTEDKAWSFDIGSVITNPEVGPFTCSVSGLPSWMTLSGCILSGTPPWTQSHTHAVAYTGQITASGPGGSSTVSAKGNVEKSFKNPHWTSSPNQLPDAYEEKAYGEDTKSYAKSYESGSLTFSIEDAPLWVRLSRAGIISGTPKRKDVGPVTVRLKLTQTVGGTVLDGGEASFQFNVIEVLHPPVWNNDPVDLGRQKEDQSFSFDLRSHVTDPENSTLKFSAAGLPTWMSLTQEGILSGTPAWTSKHVFSGNYSGITLTVTAKGGTATAAAKGEVQKTIKPPQWVANPIVLSDADEDAPYSQDIIIHVRNFEEQPLTFTLISPSSWLKLTQAGTFIGTPSKNDLGPVSATAKVTSRIDGKVYDGGTTTFTFNVNHVNHAPQWLADPLDIEPAFTKKPYTQNLARSAIDPDGDAPLSFAIIDGPSWASLSREGVFSGTPGINDVGTNTFIVSVKDPGGLEDRATLRILVNKTPEAPQWKKPVVLNNAFEDISFAEDLLRYVANPDNLPLTFTLLTHNGFDWIVVKSNGTVTGTPKANHVGINKVQIKVSSGEMNDTADVLVEVIHTNHAPYWVINPIQIEATEDQALLKDISVYAADKDKALFGDTLTFGLISSPSGSNWLGVSDKGVLSGTPKASDIGPKEYKIQVADNHGAAAVVLLIIDTKHVNHPPSWTTDPIVLPNAKEGTGYTASLSDFATDPDLGLGDKLRFQKVAGTGAEWITISSTGLVTGTPARKDVGLNRLRVRVFDSANLFDEATVEINVEKVKHPPYWTQNPIQLGEAFEDTTFNFDLKPYAKGDGEEDELTFEKTKGPDWVIVSSGGIITGIPSKADEGPFTVGLRVKNDVGAADTSGVGVVSLKNHPPVIHATLDFSIKEREVMQIDLNDPAYIVDKDGDKLRCAPVTSLSFATLNSSCVLKLSPKHADVRPDPYSLKFTVADAEYVVEGVMTIRVLRDPQKPVCSSNIIFVAKTNESFSDTLKSYCHDLDGVPLTFEKTLAWPAWLGLLPDGALSGTPKNPDVGEKIIGFLAKNDLLSTDAAFTMRVIPGTQEDKFQIDTPVVGATAENLWVIDNSSNCSPLISDLKKYSPVYFAALGRAGVSLHHTGALLSSDARPDKWDGMPVRDPKLTSDPMLFNWQTLNVAQDFNRRVTLAYSNWFCANCYSSPIWAMHRFYQHAPEPELSEIYHQGYFTANTPMDVLIVTRQRDHYKKYTTSMKPEHFARNFISFHQNESQNLRISAIAPECGGGDDTAEVGSGLFETSGDAATVAPANAYKVLVSNTHGSYYPTGCSFNMKSALEDYAKWVIFRAFVHANRIFRLTKQPTEISTIKVSLKGVELTGNTGSNSDQWRYHAGTNSIEIFWKNIDFGLLRPGDKITIFYRVS